jgi:hypothetical protein
MSGRRALLTLGVLLLVSLAGQLIGVRPAAAMPSEACARYGTLTVAVRNGVSIEPWVIDLAKQLCDRRSTASARRCGLGCCPGSSAVSASSG